MGMEAPIIFCVQGISNCSAQDSDGLRFVMIKTLNRYEIKRKVWRVI